MVSMRQDRTERDGKGQIKGRRMKRWGVGEAAGGPEKEAFFFCQPFFPH